MDKMVNQYVGGRAVPADQTSYRPDPRNYDSPDAMPGENQASEKLTVIAGHSVKELQAAHSILSDIETILFGPRPTDQGEPKVSHGGLESHLYEARAFANALNNRLAEIRGRLG